MARAKGAQTARGPGRPVKYALVKCTRCGEEHSVRSQNFTRTQSPLYAENDRFLPICKKCVREIFDTYRESLGDEKAAIRRVCMKFDIYYSDNIYKTIRNTPNTSSPIMMYIKQTGLRPYAGKTFDDTLAEEEAALQEEQPISLVDMNESEPEIDPKIVAFWGSGLTASFYNELEEQLKKWTEGRKIDDIDIGEITVIKKICLLEVIINQNVAEGDTKAVEKNVKALDALLGSANLKPVQNKGNAADEKDAMTPFGVWIKKIEDERPIAEPEEQFRDVDGIAKYISVWFLGHLSKVLNIHNRYSQLYEEEIAKLTVERPEYEGYDDEEVVEDIFDRAKKKAEVEAKLAAEGGDDEEDEEDENI